jgi:hypothetical protein
MGSSGKKKTTMAKHARETRLRERRLIKQAKKDARRQASSEQAAAEQRDTRAKDFALRRLREAPDEELALFEGTLRQDALAAGASEQELREAQSGHPGHG